MQEIKGDIWDYHCGAGSDTRKNWLVIPTNGYINRSGKGVMGKGLALQSAERFPDLPWYLGVKLKQNGNHVYKFHRWQLFTFPVKVNWWEDAILPLINQSAEELMDLTRVDLGMKIYLPRVGCGNGRLRWEQVQPILGPILADDRFTIVELM